MKLPGSAVSPALSHVLPPAQEAAVLYADGRETEAAELLFRALQGGENDAERGELWYMLFDLLRGRGDWNRYQQLSERFTKAFSVAAPQWHNEEEMARLPAELRPGAPGYFQFAGALDGSKRREMDRVREAARSLASVHLDVSRVSALDEGGCAAFAELLRFLPANGNGVMFTGASYLVEMLQTAAEGNGSVEAYWTLLMDLYRVRGLQKDFERTALEYALAMSVSPPAWQPIVMPLSHQTPTQEKRDQPRYEVGPELITLTGVMWGAADPQLAELREFAELRQYVNINLSQLRRLDFSCASAFANLLNEQIEEGKIVRLLRPNRLVAAFLATLSLNPDIVVVAARHAD
jgi:ABC-type transporter Mla MlaB component